MKKRGGGAKPCLRVRLDRPLQSGRGTGQAVKDNIMKNMENLPDSSAAHAGCLRLLRRLGPSPTGDDGSNAGGKSGGGSSYLDLLTRPSPEKPRLSQAPDVNTTKPEKRRQPAGAFVSPISDALPDDHGTVTQERGATVPSGLRVDTEDKQKGHYR